MPTRRAHNLLLVGCAGASAASERALSKEAAQIPDGIVSFAVDPATGKLGAVRQTTPFAAASYGALDAAAERLFVVGTPRGLPSTLGAFAIGPDGALTGLGVASVEGEEACHLCVDPSGQAVVSAHYSSASFAVNPVKPSGDVGAPSHLHKVTGSGPHVRQDVPHPHMVQATPDGRWIVSADLGTDEVATYRLDAATGRLAPQQVPAAKVQRGGGPRHFVFNPDGRVFVCNELDSSVTTMRYDAAAGTLAYVSHVSTLIDPKFKGEAQCGAIRLSPDGRFLYVGNRLRETIALFAIEPDRLLPIAETAAPGKSARDMWVAETVVYIAFAGADRLEVRQRDAASGAIGPVAQTVDLPVPMFILPV